MTYKIILKLYASSIGKKNWTIKWVIIIALWYYSQSGTGRSFSFRNSGL